VRLQLRLNIVVEQELSVFAEKLPAHTDSALRQRTCVGAASNSSGAADKVADGRRQPANVRIIACDRAPVQVQQLSENDVICARAC
jgi:hypothetical protein